MIPKKVLFFTAGTKATTAEQTAIDALIAGMYTIEQRNGSVSASYGENRIEPTDYVAGTVPAAFAGVPVWSGGGGDTSVAPSITTQAAIVGTPKVGVPIVVTPPVVAGNPAPNVTRSVKVAGVQVSTGAYTPVTADATKALTVEFTATNTKGSATSTAGPVNIAAADVVGQFDSTVAYANGTDVIYAGDQWKFNADHPAGNWTGSDVTFVSHLSGIETAWGSYKTLGNQNDYISGVIATADITSPTNSIAGKFEVEAPYSKVRLVTLNKEGRYKRGDKFAVSSTETAAFNTLSAAYDSVVGGVASSVAYDSNTAPNGFRKVTWNGQSSSPIQIPSEVTVPSQSHAAVQSYEFSDIINSASVTPVGSPRPFMVWRESHIVGIGDQNSSTRNGALITNYAKVAAGKPYGRLILSQGVGSNGDMVENPALAKSGTVLNPTTGGSMPNIIIQTEHTGKRVRNFLWLGDSITESYNIPQDVTCTLSTPQSPACFMNGGASGDASAQYFGFGRVYAKDSRFNITDIVVPSFSLNESTNQSTASMAIIEAALMAEITEWASRGIRVLVWTSYAALTPRFTVNGTAVAAILAFNERMRVRAAAQGAPFKLAEIENGWDQATMTSDNVHPNTETGRVYFVSRLLPAIQRM